LILDQSVVPGRAERLLFAHMWRAHLDHLIHWSFAAIYVRIGVLERTVSELTHDTIVSVIGVGRSLETDALRPHLLIVNGATTCPVWVNEVG